MNFYVIFEGKFQTMLMFTNINGKREAIEKRNFSI